MLIKSHEQGKHCDPNDSELLARWAELCPRCNKIHSIVSKFTITTAWDCVFGFQPRGPGYIWVCSCGDIGRSVNPLVPTHYFWYRHAVRKDAMKRKRGF